MRMLLRIQILSVLILLGCAGSLLAQTEPPEYRVIRTTDFDPGSPGSAAFWDKAAWMAVPPLNTALTGYATRARLLYSDRGLYVQIECQDPLLTAHPRGDFESLYLEDVAEVFLQPDPGSPVYFEYEISPFGAEAPLLISNNGNSLSGWTPWKYGGRKKTAKAVSVRGGRARPGEKIEGWSAEVFIPYLLLEGLKGCPPSSGQSWRGNVTRIDYDNGKNHFFSWATLPRPNFHNPPLFGRLVFE
ncbi:MAG: carbohydrate-binding family 9-like protein [Verrucomicrobiae bacterium]|nr:carbohydrate-binding family 9-like protein [Verrucomicrobiae bacterium]